MPSVDTYLGRRFNRRSYNCLHFARDVWADLTGVDITDRLQGLFDPENRHPSRRHFRNFTRVQRPHDPCLVLMLKHRASPHVGVYLRGRVLHIQEHGVEFLPVDVASRGFQTVRYYTC